MYRVYTREIDNTVNMTFLKTIRDLATLLLLLRNRRVHLRVLAIQVLSQVH